MLGIAGAIQPRTALNRDTFRWRTMEGQVLRLSEMKTGHIFNSMKMIFNHLAEAHGGDPIWFNHQYSDYHSDARRNVDSLAAQVCFFIAEIQLRGDLPEKYAAPFAAILGQVKGIARLETRKEVSCQV